MRFTGIFCYALCFSVYLKIKIKTIYCFGIEKMSYFKISTRKYKNIEWRYHEPAWRPGQRLGVLVEDLAFCKKTRHPIPHR